jgi:hypothetical protein
MDPLTLFALANGAVSAVKAGCKLYKDIKGAAGDIKDVLKDLDNQFHNAYEAKGKTPPPEAKKQLQEEKSRVVELNKKGGDTTSIYQEIGNYLGTYYDNFYKCMAIFEEEEKRAKTQVYVGDDSLGKRALQRVLMRKQLEHMSAELRELLVYQCPPELGALYTDVEDMMRQMGKEQSVLISKQMQRKAADERRRAARRREMNKQAMYGIAVLIVIFSFFFMMLYVVKLRQDMYPQYGNEFFPKTEEERTREALPQVYIGR